MTPLRDAADNATAGVPVVPERIWITVNGQRTSYPGGAVYLIGGWEDRPNKPHGVEYVPASELDTARAEIERLTSAVEDHVRARVATQHALTAAQEQIADALLAFDEIADLSRHLRQGGADPMDLAGLDEGLSAAVDIAVTARATLSPAVKEPK